MIEYEVKATVSGCQICSMEDNFTRRSAQDECDRLNGGIKPIIHLDDELREQAYLRNLEMRIRGLEIREKLKPAPEPGEFVVEEKYNSKGENYNNYFLDHNNQPIAILSKIVCRQLNANEARKEVAGQLELLQYHNLGWPNDFYTIVDKIKIIVKHFKAIDDYEAGK